MLPQKKIVQIRPETAELHADDRRLRRREKNFPCGALTAAFGDKGLPGEGRRDEDAPSEDFPDFLEAKGFLQLPSICETTICLIFCER